LDQTQVAKLIHMRSRVDALAFDLHTMWFGAVLTILQGDRDLLKVFIDHGADINKCVLREDEDVAPLLFMAAEMGDMPIARVLLDHGADPGFEHRLPNTDVL
jgi:predicted ribosome-associated RNA-binding protein Tma20